MDNNIISLKTRFYINKLERFDESFVIIKPWTISEWLNNNLSLIFEGEKFD